MAATFGECADEDDNKLPNRPFKSRFVTNST